MKRYTALVAGLVAIFATAVILPTQPAFAATVNVDITVGSSSKTTNAYAPNPAEVNVGDTVTWTNKDGQPHTATSGDASGGATGVFGGEAGAAVGTILTKDQTQSFTFEEAGEFDYYCTLHPTMVGTVVVAGEGGNGGGAMEETEVEAEIDGNTFTVVSRSETAHALEATIMPDEKMVGVEFEDSGDVELTLPKALISGISAVTTSAGDPVEFQETNSTDADTTISFTLPEGETYVDITGATVAPEFGVIAALVLAGSLVAAIGVARFRGSSLGFGRF